RVQRDPEEHRRRARPWIAVRAEAGGMTTVPPYPEGHGLLAGKTLLVTAAAGTGIGFATAKRCVEEGATVAISDKHERRLAESAKELGDVGSRNVIAVPCDVTVEDDVHAMFTRVVDELGRLD